MQRRDDRSGGAAQLDPSLGIGGSTTGRNFILGDRRIQSHGLQRQVFQDLYHYCMTVSWLRFFASWIVIFLAFNLVFALLYYAVPGCVANIGPAAFTGCFFFSVETLATVGYGDMHPATLYGHITCTVEIFLGMANIALATGIIFARFSRPTARFLFANVAVVRPMDGRTVLMLRTANARQNIVREASAKLRLIRKVVTREGYRMRRIEDLALVRDEQPLFVLGWNLMHVIDEKSPLHGQTLETLAATDAFLNLSLSGSDETTGQVLMAHHGYPAQAIRWNHSFRDIIHEGVGGIEHFDYTKFHDVDPLQDPRPPPG